MDIARFTEALVVVGFLQFLILSVQWWTLWRQSIFFRNSERAWISVELDWDKKKWADGKFHMLLGSGTMGDDTVFEAIVVCKNEGKSPAWIEEKRARFELFSVIPEKPYLDST